MKLEAVRDSNYYLVWKDFDFGSDSIIVELRYKKYMHVIDKVADKVGDIEAYYENLVRRSYTIGGMIIFPKHINSMNQMRGTCSKISDRWDLTLECIRRYYIDEKSPLSSVIGSDKEFFDLFVDFKGYVEFFFLQDCVSDDYSEVDIWCGDTSFEKSGLPVTVDDYFEFIRKEHEFLDKSNERIKEYNNLIVPILEEKGIIINDLFSVVYPHRQEYLRDDHLHLAEVGAQACAEQTVRIIREVAKTL
jgi:hypothetical protein